MSQSVSLLGVLVSAFCVTLCVIRMPKNGKTAEYL
jgi:hypothetical protein